MVQQIKTVKLRCYPDDDQLNQLPQMFGNVRFVYNYMLNLQNYSYKHFNNHLSRFDMNKLITRLKKKSRYQWLKFSESTSLLEACHHLDIAYQRFFTKQGGYPRFKRRSYNQSYTSLTVNHNIKQLSHGFVQLPKLGQMQINPYKVKGSIVSMTLRETARGHYYLMLVIKRGIKPLPKTKKTIGIDLGLRNLMNLSNGVKYKSLKFDNLNHKIELAQRKLSRRILNAKKQEQIDIQRKHKFNIVQYQDAEAFRNLAWYERRGVVSARRHLAKLHAEKANQRKDYLQKLSTKLIRQYDVIVFEDLRPSNMMKNHHLARTIGEQGWRMLITMCQYKVKWYDKEVILVSPRNTTQTCASCGYKLVGNQKLDLSIEHWQCPQCHANHDRDVNAAKNILALAS